MPVTEYPFLMAVSEYGHFDVRFVEEAHYKSEHHETMRWLPPAHAPLVPWLYDAIQEWGPLVAVVRNTRFDLSQPIVREVLCNARARVELWVGEVTCSGALLFSQDSSLDGIALEYGRSGWPYIHGVRLVGDVSLRRWPLRGTPLAWSVSNAPLPGNEVDGGLWHVWHGRLHIATPEGI